MFKFFKHFCTHFGQFMTRSLKKKNNKKNTKKKSVKMCRCFTIQTQRICLCYRRFQEISCFIPKTTKIYNKKIKSNVRAIVQKLNFYSEEKNIAFE